MRAIICDDDEIILRGLRSVIDWASLGIELVGTAGNGKEGLALLKEQRPELLGRTSAGLRTPSDSGRNSLCFPRRFMRQRFGK